MKYIKYLIQFILIILLFIIFKIIGLNNSSYLGGKLFQFIGSLFRSKKIIQTNIKKALPNIDEVQIKNITNKMWDNYGRVFAEYIFIKKLRNDYFSSHIIIKGQEILKNIKKNNKPVIFVSGHFSNFELMAMTIKKLSGKLTAI